MANGIDIISGEQITQKVTEGITNTVNNSIMGFLMGIVSGVTDLAFWAAIIAIPLLFTETGQKFLNSIIGDDMFGRVMEYRDGAMAWLGSNGIGKMLDTVLNAIGLGTPFQDMAKKFVTNMTEAQFQEQSGLPADAAKVLYPKRAALFEKGITSADEALKPENAKFLLETFSTRDLTKLFDSLKTSGTAEQQQKSQAAIDTLLKDESIKKLLNDKHPELVRKFAAETFQPQAGASNSNTQAPIDLTKIREQINSPEGLRMLAIAAPTIPADVLGKIGLTQAQLQSAIADMQANNPKGQAYKTLINSDALPILAPAMKKLESGTNLSAALDVLRDPKVREQLNKPEIMGAITQLAPQNDATRFLFTSATVDNKVTYPNIQAAQQFATFIDNGTEQQRAQRSAAVGAVDSMLNGKLPAAGSPERATLQTFLGDAENSKALLGLVRSADISSLNPEQAKFANLVRGQHGEGLLKVLGSAEGMKWLEAQQNPQAPTNLWDKFTNGVTNVIASQLPTATAIKASPSAPDVVKQNADAIAALSEIIQPHAQAKASVPETDQDIAKKISDIGANARASGISGGTTATGSPNAATLATLPPQQREVNAIH